MPPELPKAEVLVADMEVIRDTLENAYLYSKTLDITDAYRKQDNRAPESQLTKRLERALAKANLYLEEDDE